MKAKNCIKDLKRREREREKESFRPTESPFFRRTACNTRPTKWREFKKKRRENSRDSRIYFWLKIERDSSAFSARPKSPIPPDLSVCHQDRWIRSPSECKFESSFACQSICDLNCSYFTLIQIKGILRFCILLSFFVRNGFGFLRRLCFFLSWVEFWTCLPNFA